MSQQVVLVACSGDSNVVAWDLATGTQLTQYKGNNSGHNCFCLLGKDYFASAQANKDAVHFYAFHKDQVLQRSFAQERLSALAASRDGRYLAGGGASGTVYLWDASSGQLLRAWPAHYKAVSCLAFSEAGSILLSGGEDTMAAAWLLVDVLDGCAGGGAAAAAGGWQAQGRVEPLHTWSEHTLPVTSALLGMGEINAIAVTTSLDRTAKVWQLATGALLRAAPLPAGATAAALDAGEHALYVGCADGSICEVPLAGGDGGGVSVMEGHSKAVSSLSLSLDGDSLVSGSEDGSVRVWDLRSRQCVRVVPAPAKAPVAAALVVEWPDYLAGVGQATAGSSGRQGPKRPQPLAPLAKFQGGGSGSGAGARPWEGPPLVIDGSCPPLGVGQLPGLLLPRGAALLAAADGGGGLGGELLEPAAFEPLGGGGGGGADEVADLRRRLAEAEAAADRWKALHGELHAFCTEQVLDGAKT